MERDALIILLAGVAIGVTISMLMSKRDRGTMILRDRNQNIVGLLPMGERFLDIPYPQPGPEQVIVVEETAPAITP